MGQVDDLHDTHDQSHADADDGIEAPDEDAANHCLEKYRETGHRTPSLGKVWVRFKATPGA